MTTVEVDSENPEVFKSNSWFNVDPALPTTMISIGANFILSNMFVYGFTGNAKMAYLAGVLTVPISLFTCVSAATEDFERWKKMKKLRERNMPTKLMPYPYKFDWTEYEAKMMRQQMQRAADDLSGTAKD